MRLPLLPAVLALPLVACGVGEKIEQRVQEKVAEAAIEVAAGGEVDVEAKDGKVEIEAKDGTKLSIDGEAGRMEVRDADGKRYEYTQAKDGSLRVESSDGNKVSMGESLPPDFPLALPAGKVSFAQRLVDPEGGKTFNAGLVYPGGELETLADRCQTALAAKGLKVERMSIAGAQQVINLSASDPDPERELSASCTVMADEGSTDVSLVVSWSAGR